MCNTRIVFTQIMQHPAIKAERIDLSYLPPSYYQQQQQQQQIQQRLQQQQQQQQQHARMAPQTQYLPTNQSVQQTNAQKSAGSQTKNVEPNNVENQPDFQSIKGVFGWTVIDRVNLPYILRGDKQFVSVRIVEMKLLSRYPNSYPDDLGKQAPLTSFFITSNEAKLLNEINSHHCAGEYGKKEFTTKDLIVLLSDFIKFYNLVKKTFPDAVSAQKEAAEAAGWLQIKNTVTPYIKRVDAKFVPLSVIQYAAGLLTNENVSGMPPTKKECDMLNEACKTAGVEFVFSDSTTRLIDVRDILKISPVDIIELPPINPLKHATYMELPTTSARSADKTKSAASSLQSSSRSGQPYMFQPGAQLDMTRAPFQGSMNRPEQNGSRFPMPPQAGFPGNQMFHQRMMDPRMVEMYRMQYRPVMQNGPPNVRHSQVPYNQLVPQVNPMMQYYMNMQNNQNMRNQSPGSQTNKELTQQRPVSSGPDSSPRTQSRSSSGSVQQSGSRPPSNSRPPSGSPLGSPLSPTGHGFSQMSRINSNPSFTSLSDAVTSVVPQIPHLNGGAALQQMQNMFAQRFPMPNGMSNMSPSNQNQAFFQGMPGTPHQEHTQKTMQMSSPNQLSAQTQVSLNQNANQEIPGLFSPTGTNVAPSNTSVSARQSNDTSAVPPPLQLMSSPPLTSVVKTVSVTSPQSVVHPSVSVSQTSDRELPVPMNAHIGAQMPAPRNQPLPAAISAAKSQVSLVKCIEGAWLNNKSISCLCLDQGDRIGRYCLVEAVCKLYFNGCSVNEFLFALENVLNVPLLTCNEVEEKAFIQYYSLPVVTLKCNKMIKFDDLEKYFPQLTYMFPSKEAIAQSESEIDQSELNETGELSGPNSLLTPEEVEATLPTTIREISVEVGEKRPADVTLVGSPPKRQRLRGKVPFIFNLHLFIKV